MDAKTFNDIKEKYGKDASWAIWDSAGKSARDGYERHKHLDNYEEIKDRINPNIVLVGLNQALEMPIKETFSNFHLFENDIVTQKKGFRNEVGLVMHPNTPIYTNNLIYAIKGTEYEGAYMTDIIKHKTVKNKVKDLANANNIMDYLKKHPGIIEENIEIFKEELKLIGSENPLIIALGSNTHWILSKCFACIKISHYSDFKYNRNPEAYKTDFWNAVKNGGTSTAHRDVKVARQVHSHNMIKSEPTHDTSSVPSDRIIRGLIKIREFIQDVIIRDEGRDYMYRTEYEAFKEVQNVLSHYNVPGLKFSLFRQEKDNHEYSTIYLDEKREKLFCCIMLNKDEQERKVTSIVKPKEYRVPISELDKIRENLEYVLQKWGYKKTS